jgi:hypothetical protein
MSLASSSDPISNELNVSPQKAGTVPAEVVNLYSKKKTVQRTKHYSKDTPEKAKQMKMNSYLTKLTDTRTNRFDSNRINSATNSNSLPENPDIALNELNDVLAEANSLSSEYNLLLQNEDIDVKALFKMMGRMNKNMLNMMIQLKSVIETKNNAIVNSFTNKLKNCTSFISNEINYVKKEIDKVKRNDEIECLKTIQACSRDLKRIWIRFVYANDAEEARNKNNHAAIKVILSQLNVPINMAQYPVESFYFQSRTFSPDQLIPEIALCCIFANSTLATVVKNGIVNFNRHLEEKNQQHLIRYKVSTDWSYNIRLILKPCNEMRRFDLIDRVFITNDGIKVYHRELERYDQPGKNSTMTIVNSMKKLDILRRKLKDYNFTVPASETYNGDYFNKSFNERKSLRDNFTRDNEMYNNDEIQVSDDEFMDASIVDINQ